MQQYTPEEIEMGYNKPISTSDAAGMLRMPVPRNGKPYDVAVIKANNKLIDNWKRDVLDKMSVNRMIPAGNVWGSWKLYEEGINCLKMQDIFKTGNMPEYPENVIQFWKVFFEDNTVEELHAYGTGTVSSGWTIIQTYLKTWFLKEKYEKLFSQNDDPLWWEKNYHSHIALFKGEVFPFWSSDKIKEIHEKILPVLALQVKPDQGNYSKML